MTFFTKDPKRIQTTWGLIGGNKNFLAYIDADIQDEAVIEQAKKIVDRCSPQRYGPNGTHAYSFLQREYLLNLLLFHYVDHDFSRQDISVLLMNGFIRAQLKLLVAGGLALSAGLKVGTIRRGGGSKFRAC